MRVVAYNLGGAVDPRAVAGVLRHVRPDIVCAVEAPPRFLLRRIARDGGLRIATRCGGRRTGTAVLTGPGVRLLTTDQLDLPRHGTLPRRWVAQAIVSAEGERVACLAVQLGMNADEREEHAGDVLAMAELIGAPVVVGGDLNETPTGPAARRFAASLVDAHAARGLGEGPTFPNPDPHLRVDYVFVDPDLSIGRVDVASDPPVGAASHHRPVVAEIGLDGGAAT